MPPLDPLMTPLAPTLQLPPDSRHPLSPDSRQLTGQPCHWCPLLEPTTPCRWAQTQQTHHLRDQYGLYPPSHHTVTCCTLLCYSVLAVLHSTSGVHHTLHHHSATPATGSALHCYSVLAVLHSTSGVHHTLHHHSATPATGSGLTVSHSQQESVQCCSVQSCSVQSVPHCPVQCCAVAVHLQHHHHHWSVLGHPESEGDTVLYCSAVAVTVSHCQYYSVLCDLEMREDYLMSLADNRVRLLAGNLPANPGHQEGC